MKRIAVSIVSCLAFSVTGNSQFPNRAISVLIQPTGQWCGGNAKFSICISNQGSGPYYFGLPKEAGSKWPYGNWRYSIGIVSTTNPGGLGGGGSSSCEPDPDGLGRLCNKPALPIKLDPEQGLNWDFDLSLTPDEGNGDFKLTLSWFGSTTESEALSRIDTGTAECRITIRKTSDNCFFY